MAGGTSRSQRRYWNTTDRATAGSDGGPSGGAARRPVSGGRLDRVAIWLSFGCLVHCLVLPLMIVAVPVLASLLPGDEWLHVGLLIAALPVSAVALWLGRRHHDRWLPVALGCPGLLLLAAGAAARGPAGLEVGLTVLGSCLVIVAHTLNARACSRAIPAMEHGGGRSPSDRR